MSAIAAVLDPGSPGDDTQAARMLEAMRRRGPDGTVLRMDGPVALGCARFNADHGGLAIDHSLVVAFDGRLDNRADVQARLGLSGDAGIDDAWVVAVAWRRWGEDCPPELLGDFAFLLWDGDRRQLFAACDGFAVKTLAYAAADGRVAFASEPAALRAIGFGRDLDDAAVASLLSGVAPAPCRTLYRGIAQLEPGHCCIVGTDGAVRLRRYWALTAPEPQPRRDAPEELRAIFTEAVRCRLGPPDRTASLLSGGLDSSSITRVAAELRRQAGQPALRTYSLVYDRTPEHSERHHIEAVLACGGCDPVFIDADDLSPFADFDAALDAQDGIFLGPNYATTQRTDAAATAGGTRILLDGHGGDEVISHGTGLLAELAIAGSWATLRREIAAGSRHQPINVAGHVAAYAVQFGLPPQGRRLVRSLTRRLGRGSATPVSDNFLDADLARQLPSAPIPAPRRHEERFAHLRVLEDPSHPYAFRLLDRAAVAAGLSLRFPFWDRRLVEFCLSLPAEEKMGGGMTRLILRRAMEGVLPASVQWRPDKMDFTIHFIRGMTGRDRAIVEDVLADRRGDLRGYVNAPAARTAFAAMAADPTNVDGRTAFAIWRVVAFGLWRRRLVAR